MYNLQKYNGISSRYTCPHCGRKRCFTLYVDEDGDPLHESVGRCDHESSCGYHYTPKQHFADWSRKLAALAELDPSSPARPGISITVSPILKQNATAEDLAAHIDIADWLIRYRYSSFCHSERSPQGEVEESPRRHCVDFLKAARYISPDYHEELEALIQDLDLEFWGVERIKEETSD
jgi:hypothetical protein